MLELAQGKYHAISPDLLGGNCCTIYNIRVSRVQQFALHHALVKSGKSPSPELREVGAAPSCGQTHDPGTIIGRPDGTKWNLSNLPTVFAIPTRVSGSKRCGFSPWLKKPARLMPSGGYIYMIQRPVFAKLREEFIASQVQSDLTSLKHRDVQRFAAEQKFRRKLDEILRNETTGDRLQEHGAHSPDHAITISALLATDRNKTKPLHDEERLLDLLDAGLSEKFWETS